MGGSGEAPHGIENQSCCTSYNAMQQGRAAAAHAYGLVFGVEIDRSPSSAVYGLPEAASASCRSKHFSRLYAEHVPLPRIKLDEQPVHKIIT